MPALCGHSLVVLGDAKVSSHTHDGAMVVGGSLTDGTPHESATVSGDSFVRSFNGPHRFQFDGTLTTGSAAPFPFDWRELEFMARSVEELQDPEPRDGQPQIHVRCSGGHVNLYDFYGSYVSGRSGFNGLVVFNTEEDVTIDGNSYGRPFAASILAPFSHVTILKEAGYVDGFVVAKSLDMDQDAGSLQVHAHCYSGPLGCLRGTIEGQGNCGGSAAHNSIWTGGMTHVGRPDCSCQDLKSSRRCAKKRMKGKCRKPRVSSVKCRATCGACRC